MRRVAVIGGTFSGNMGSAGMLESLIFNLTHRCSGRAWFDVLSVYPARDRARDLPESVRIVPATPPRLVLMLLPLALLYALLGLIRLPRGFLLVFRPLEAIARASVLLDVAGISFVDGRGATLLYNIACILPALLVGTPVVKMSQALGPFRSPANRTAARLLLPRIERIFARGGETERNLSALGLSNVTPAADLAFVLNEHNPAPPLCGRIQGPPARGATPVIGVCPSRVLAGACARRGADLVGILADFIATLRENRDAHVIILAHSLLEPERRSRNNDYHICRELYERLDSRERVSLVIEDLTPSELRAVIGRCDVIVAARFHAMISAVCAGVPPIVPAWSHKYREVMEEFGLGELVIELSSLSAGRLYAETRRLLEERDCAAALIRERLPAVADSARVQIEYVAERLEETGDGLRASAIARGLRDRFYRERFLGAWTGYASSAELRSRAASGGLVSALLVAEMRAGRITGAIACRTDTGPDGLAFRTLRCVNEAEILACRTSIYSDFNHAKQVIEIVKRERGVFAIVALPCQWRAINAYFARRPELSDRIGLRIGLWCGHVADRRLVDDFLRLKKVPPESCERFYFRTGLWRGETKIEMRGGAVRRLSFAKGYGLLHNLYVDCPMRCFSCADHFAERADVSFGDAWLKELRGAPIKHSMAAAFTERGVRAIRDLAVSGGAFLEEVDPALAVQAQKRAVIWHTYGAAGRGAVGRLFGYRLPGVPGVTFRWNDLLSAFMVLAAHRAYGSALRRPLLRMPWPLPYAYMLAQKFFLNF